MWYHATKKTKMAEPVDICEDRMEECVVLFCCVEKLDEKNPERVIKNAMKNVVARLSQLKVNRVMIYPYAHLTSTLGSPDCALCILKGLEEALRSDGIDVKRAPFREADALQVCRQAAQCTETCPGKTGITGER
jgi:threonyl-tRNA synthetase